MKVSITYDDTLYQLVPKEPDWNMEMCGIKKLERCTEGELECIGEKLLDDLREKVSSIFAGMLSAAPTPPAQPAERMPLEWMPIETAMPKSGQVVLALQKWDHSGRQSIIRASWVPAKTEESGPDSDIGEYDEATDTYYDPEGWYEQVSHWDEYAAIGVSGATITHWMPLPAAPKEPTRSESLIHAVNHVVEPRES